MLKKKKRTETKMIVIVASMMGWADPLFSPRTNLVLISSATHNMLETATFVIILTMLPRARESTILL